MAVLRLLAEKAAAMARLLVIQPAFLGDLILTLPLVGRLREAFPEAELHLLVRQGIEPLLYQHPWQLHLWTWDKSWRSWWQLQRALGRYSWEGIFVVQRFFRMGLLGRSLPARWRITYDKNPLSFLYTYRVKHRFAAGLHETERVLALLKPLGIPAALPPRPWLFPPAEAHEKVAPYTRKTPYLVVSPTSRWPTKEAPFALWYRFLEQVPKDFTLYLTGLSADRARLNPLTQAHPHCYNLAGQLSLPELTALVQRAYRTFTVDSALTHIASAVGCPTTTVFCATVPAFGFGPLAPDSTIVETAEALPCRPCGLHGSPTCPKKHFRCGHTLRPEVLLATLSAAPPPAPRTAASPPPLSDTAPSP